MDIPMLEDHEWEQVYPLLRKSQEKIKQYREKNGCDLKTAIENIRHEACLKYEELTGFKETNPNAVWHHHLSNFGPECQGCGHLLRTPKANYCANCGKICDRNT